ncbi:MAG: PHP domain-containing protein [Spirochaetes bacterium]|nr:PHP domain-containing protein [Spirochaetota bacterium]
MIKKIDLHVHTKASDGIYTPKEIIDYAIANGISSLAITDHDTVDGLAEAMDYANKIGFELIPGVEFGLEYKAGSFHLLGLYVDYGNPALIEATEFLKKSRMIRLVKMVELLNNEGYNISLKEVEQEAMGAAVGKPHIARIMIRRGYAEDMAYVFKNFMIKGKPGHVKRDRIFLNEAVSVIKNSGGIPIIAHPISLNAKSFDDFEDKLDEFILGGVQGIEVYSSMHTMNDVAEFLRIADKKNILISGGSDFHGDKGKRIGVYTDGNFIPDYILDDIKNFVKDR